MTRFITLLAVVIFAALTTVVALQVLNRMALHLPLIWSEEVARFLFFWVALLGAAISVRRRRHFVLDVTAHPGGGPRRRQARWLALVPHVCVIGFSLFLLVVSIGYVEAGLYRTATNSQVNMGFVYAAIPVFALLSAIYAGAHLRADARARRDAAPAPPGLSE